MVPKTFYPVGNLPTRSTDSGLENYMELRTEGIRKAVSELSVLQSRKPAANPERYDNNSPARRTAGENLISGLYFVLWIYRHWAWRIPILKLQPSISSVVFHLWRIFLTWPQRLVGLILLNVSAYFPSQYERDEQNLYIFVHSDNCRR